MEFKENNKNAATVVIVGSWNSGVLTPEFVKENILIDEEFKVYYPQVPMLSLMFLVEKKYRFQLNGNRLEFCLMNNTEGTSKDIINVIRNILRCLIFTPVQSVGINFLFDSNELNDELHKLGRIELLKTVIEGELDDMELTRSFKLKDRQKLNFKVFQSIDCTKFDFNYSYNVNNCKEILEIFGSNDAIISLRERSLSILEQVYNNAKQLQ